MYLRRSVVGSSAMMAVAGSWMVCVWERFVRSGSEENINGGLGPRVTLLNIRRLVRIKGNHVCMFETSEDSNSVSVAYVDFTVAVRLDARE